MYCTIEGFEHMEFFKGHSKKILTEKLKKWVNRLDSEN
jgi:hypothetical protein